MQPSKSSELAQIRVNPVSITRRISQRTRLEDTIAAMKPEEFEEAAERWNIVRARHKQHFADIDFHMDDIDPPNVSMTMPKNHYPRLSVTQGLITNKHLKLEGLALAAAHELGHLLGGAPVDGHGMPCEGQADYFAVPQSCRTSGRTSHLPSSGTASIR
jgi:Zn-dependent protease with chaperone function